MSSHPTPLYDIVVNALSHNSGTLSSIPISALYFLCDQQDISVVLTKAPQEVFSCTPPQLGFFSCIPCLGPSSTVFVSSPLLCLFCLCRLPRLGLSTVHTASCTMGTQYGLGSSVNCYKESHDNFSASWRLRSCVA